jgi:DNA-binding NtrC family response regulator
MAHVLVVDDEPNMRWVLQEALTRAGHTPHAVGSGPEALALLATTPIDLVILDLKLKGMDGLATLRTLHQRWPEVVVVMLTAYGTVATAVEALQSGAADYLRKPFDVEEILFKISRALERQALQHEVQRLRGERPAPLPGSHPAWRRAVEAATQAVAQGHDVCLIGQPGSGRATLARAAHAASPRCQAPLVEYDLETLPADRQGAFLAGSHDAGGAWSRAGAGTLLLRHAAALSAEGAAALAHLLKQRAAHPHGPLLLMTASEAAVPGLTDWPGVVVRVPPLREHLDDMVLLAHAWLDQGTLTPAAMHLLHQYPWPGNIAELRGVLERAAVLAHGAPIDAAHLPPRVQDAPLPGELVRLPPAGMSLEAVERSLIRQALAQAGGNKSRAADLLGLTRHTLLYRLEKYRLTAG